jgi:hypothetical protein
MGKARWRTIKTRNGVPSPCDGQSDPRVKPEDDDEKEEAAMPLILTEEQTMLKEAADGFLNEHAPIAHLRKLRDSKDADGVSRDLWRAFGEMGFAGVIIPEEHGGSGLGAVEAGVMAEALGRTLTPSPFLGSGVLSATVLKGGSAEQQQAWLPRIAAGEAIVSLAVAEGPGSFTGLRIATVAARYAVYPGCSRTRLRSSRRALPPSTPASASSRPRCSRLPRSSAMPRAQTRTAR